MVLLLSNISVTFIDNYINSCFNLYKVYEMVKRYDYSTIGVPREEFAKLSEAKTQYEEDIGKKVDWGKFLLILALGYLAVRKIQQDKEKEGISHQIIEGEEFRMTTS